MSILPDCGRRSDYRPVRSEVFRACNSSSLRPRYPQSLPRLPTEDMPMRLIVATLVTVLCSPALLCIGRAQDAPKLDTSRGDKMIAEYFRIETARLSEAALADVTSADEWEK